MPCILCTGFRTYVLENFLHSISPTATISQECLSNKIRPQPNCIKLIWKFKLPRVLDQHHHSRPQCPLLISFVEGDLPSPLDNLDMLSSHFFSRPIPPMLSFDSSTTDYLSRTFPWRVPATLWAQGEPRSDTRDLWRHWWEEPSDRNVSEGPERLECLSPTETRSHEGKAISYE